MEYFIRFHLLHLGCTFLPLILTFGSVQSYRTVAMNLTTPRSYNSIPAAYRSENVTLAITITGNTTDVESKLILTVPHRTTTNEICSVTTYNGNTYQCVNVTEREVLAIVMQSEIEVRVGNMTPGVGVSGFHVLSDNSPSGPYEIVLEFENSVATQDIVINVPFEFSNSVPSIGENITFTSSFNTSDGFQSVITESITMVIVGPQLECTMISSVSSEIESGRSFDIRANISHSPESTEAAENIMLSFNPGSSAMTINGSATVAYPNGTVISGSNFTDLNSLLQMLSTLNRSELISLTIPISVDDSIPLHSTIFASFDGTYTHSGSSSDPSALTGCTLSLATMPITITNAPTSIPPELHPGEEMKMEATMTMGYGTVTLRGMNMRSDITGTNHPIEGESVSIRKDSALLSSGSGFMYTPPKSRRRKRAVTNTFLVTEDAPLTIVRRSGEVPSPVITIQGKFKVSDSAAGATGDFAPFITVNGNNVYLGHSKSKIVLPILLVTKTVEMADASTNPQRVRFTVQVTHDPDSSDTAHDVRIRDDVSNFEYYPDYGFKPDFGAGSGVHFDPDRISYFKPQYPATDKFLLSYVAGPKGTSTDYLPAGDTYKNVTLEYHMQYTDIDGKNVDVKYTVTSSACVRRNGTVTPSGDYQYGFAIMTGFFGLLAGILVAAIIVLLVVCVCKGGRQSEVSPASRDEMKKMQSKMRNVMIDVDEAMKKSGNLIKDYSLISVDESIVFILAMKDKLGIHRELDNLDILSTIYVDQNLENERNNAAIQGTTLLVQGLRRNGDLTPEAESKSLGLFMKQLNDMDKNLETDYRKELKKILKKLASKNKAKLAELLQLQREEKQRTQGSVMNLPEEDQKELMDLLEQKHSTEQNELAYRLKLEQDEETENLRKEFAVRRRMGIKESQQLLLDNVNQNLNQDQIDWLMKEHMKNQANLEMMYDEEISKQRMSLEEKLARRKQLAAEIEMQEEDQSAVLNTMAGQELGMIKSMKKEGVITKAEMKEMIQKLKEDMLKVKDKMEVERKRQEDQLHKELSARKKARLEAKQKEQAAQLAALDEKNKAAQTDDRPIDPMSYLESRMTLLSHQRIEIEEIQNEMDAEHAQELKKLREQSLDGTKQILTDDKDKLFETLRQDGMTEAQMNKLLRQHEKELQALTAAQEEDRQIQYENFKRRLSKNRKNWDKRKLEEKQEQEQLRNHEENVVRNIMENQVSMSDLERDRVLKEHEKQMVKLENSLTLNKLRQKRMLEDKLAKKRSMQMEKLEKKQMSETKKMKTRLREENSEDEDEEEKKRNEQINMLKKHAEQKIAILHGDKLKLEDELEEIRTEMMQERALALKEQEEHLAAMLASLQLEKAKEMAKIEEQQKAINSLKSNLMEDLTDKGVLSSPECQKVIEIHQKEKEKLNKRLDAQKAKQEKLLREKLAERMEQKEEALKNLHEKELLEVLGGTTSKAAAKLKRVALMHKHMVASERFRNRMEKEMNQTLEDVRRQYELRKAEAVQNQELQFIGGLVRLGAFQKDELLDVLRMLFPLRQEAEIAEIFKKIYDEDTAKAMEAHRKEPPPLTTSNTLSARIKAATYASLEDRMPVFGRKRKGKKKKSKHNVNEATPDRETSFNGSFCSSSVRPEPIGQQAPDQFDHDEEYLLDQQKSSRQLPPLRRNSLRSHEIY